MRKTTIAILLLLLTACDKDEPQEPTSTTTTRPSISNPVCPPHPMSSTGTLGGFLWKPVSERGALAVLLPGNYTRKFDRCEVLKRGGVTERLMWSGFTNPDGDHGNKLRQTWRGRSPGSAYVSHRTVRCYGEGQLCEWKYKDSGTRMD